MQHVTLSLDQHKESSTWHRRLSNMKMAVFTYNHVPQDARNVSFPAILTLTRRF